MLPDKENSKKIECLSDDSMAILRLFGQLRTQQKQYMDFSACYHKNVNNIVNMLEKSQQENQPLISRCQSLEQELAACKDQLNKTTSHIGTTYSVGEDFMDTRVSVETVPNNQQSDSYSDGQEGDQPCANKKRPLNTTFSVGAGPGPLIKMARVQEVDMISEQEQNSISSSVLSLTSTTTSSIVPPLYAGKQHTTPACTPLTSRPQIKIPARPGRMPMGHKRRSISEHANGNKTTTVSSLYEDAAYDDSDISIISRQQQMDITSNTSILGPVVRDMLPQANKTMISLNGQQRLGPLIASQKMGQRPVKRAKHHHQQPQQGQLGTVKCERVNQTVTGRQQPTTLGPVLGTRKARLSRRTEIGPSC